MDFLKLFRRRETKQSAAAQLMVLTPGQPVWSPRNYEQFAKEAYAKNFAASQSIKKIADAVADIKLMVFKGETELTEHPLLKLLDRPNPAQSSAAYMQAKVAFLLISGNGFEERLVVGKEVRELYQLRPDRMKIIPSASGSPAAYEYEVGGRKHRWDVDPVTLDGDVRHTKFFNPVDDWYGLSPIEPGAYGIDQLNESMAWIQALLQNSARPSGALVLDKDANLTTDQYNDLKTQIEGQYSGSRNAGRPLLLGGGMDWKQMGLSPVDMDVIKLKESASRDVALTLGVPPLLLGLPGDNTYANYAEARLAFYEDTVIPFVRRIVADWNAWLASRWGVTIVPDIDAIPAISEKRLKTWVAIDGIASLKPNEKRELMKFEPEDGGDKIMVPSSLVPLTMAVEPPKPDPKADEMLNPADAKALAYGLESGKTH